MQVKLGVFSFCENIKIYKKEEKEKTDKIF